MRVERFVKGPDMKYIVRIGYAFHANEFVGEGYAEGETFEADPEHVADQLYKLDPERPKIANPPVAEPVFRKRRGPGRPPKNRAFEQPPASVVTDTTPNEEPRSEGKNQ